MLCSVVSLANDSHSEGPMRHNFKNWLINLLFSQNISIIIIIITSILSLLEKMLSIHLRFRCEVSTPFHGWCVVVL